MRFATKIFLAVFLTALSLILGISLTLYTFLATATRSQYVAHYESVTHQVAAMLTQLEATTDVFMQSAVRTLAERVRTTGVLSPEDLLRLRDELGVSHLYILNSEGVFLRSTREDPAGLPNAFSFCPHYRRMFEQGESFIPTGLMPCIPGFEPYKFLFMPSLDRRYLLEVGMRADFIGQTLKQAVTSDPDFISIALYAPNGANLGEFAADGNTSYERSLNPSASFTRGTTFRSGRLQVAERVAASNRECCSCRQRGLIKDGDYHYYLRTVVSTRALDAALRRLTVTTVALATLALLLSAIASRTLSRRLVARLNLINDQTHAIMRTGDLNRRLNLSGSDEIDRMSAKFDEMLGALQIKQEELIKLEKSRAAIETTNQVAHDIRSPLATLDTLLGLTQDLPEDQRVLLRAAVGRIHAISNNLLEQTKRLRGSHPGEIPQDSNAVSSESVWSLVMPVLSEKRQQYHARPQLTLELLNPARAYGLFVHVNTQLFQRTLSNLVDNAVDAIEDAGSVKILVESHDGRVRIVIRDTGRGIPRELLPTLMNKGRTYGKSSGSGLGLYAARQAVLSWAGDLQITSELHQGTEVTIALPAASAPAWFVPSIRMHANTSVVVVDDDSSIHEIWRTRFKTLLQVPLLHFSTTQEFQDWFKQDRVNSAQLLVLMDAEFQGGEESGLDCIESLGLSEVSILVTSAADESLIRERCARFGVRLLPKNAAPLIQIEVDALQVRRDRS